MPRGRPSAEAADEAEVESVSSRLPSGRSLANRERRSRGGGRETAGISPGLPDATTASLASSRIRTASRKVRRYALRSLPFEERTDYTLLGVGCRSGLGIPTVPSPD